MNLSEPRQGLAGSTTGRPSAGAGLTVSVLIASVDRIARLLTCIESVKNSDPAPDGGLEIIVVSGSYGRSDQKAIRDSGAKLVALSEQVLSSAAHNIGAGVAHGEYLLFVDDDNVVAPDAIWRLASALAEGPGLALVGPVMYYGDEPDRIWCAGVLRSKVMMKTKLRSTLPLPLPDRLPSEDFPNCFMVRRRDFEVIEGFDVARFPHHMAEGDLARRLSLTSGGTVQCVTRARVWHFIGKSFARRLHVHDRQRAYWVGRSRTLYTALYGSRLQWFMFVAVGQWILSIVYVAAITAQAPRDRGRMVESYLRGLGAGLREGLSARKSLRSRPPSTVTEN